MFKLVWLPDAAEQYASLEQAARRLSGVRAKKRTGKSSHPEGLFKQVHKTLMLLRENPRHPGLQTHEYASIDNPYDSKSKVFEAYVQNKTPGAYRVFWCYGPERGQMTIIAITAHP